MAVKLTSAYVVELPLTLSGQRYVYDAALPGFGVRIGTEKKAYIAQARVAGKVSRVTLGATTSLTCEAARRLAKEALGKMAGGTDLIKQKAEQRVRTITLQEAITAYLKGRTIKASTAANVESVMRANFSDWAGKQLKDITPATYLKRHAAMTEKAAAGANLAGRYFRAIWNYNRAASAKADGTYILPECPVKRVSETRKWNKVSRRKTYVPNDRMPAFFAAVNGLTSDRHPEHAAAFRDLLELYLRTGLRRAEGMGLAWADVSLSGQLFTIRDPKNGQDLTLPMSKQVLALFLRRKEATGGKGYVFSGSGETGRMVDPRKLHDRVREAYGEDFGFHDLRRTFATLAERLDLSAYAIKRLLNHSEGGDVTAGYLVHDPERLRDPMQRISDELDRLAKVAPVAMPEVPADAPKSETQDHRHLSAPDTRILNLLG